MDATKCIREFPQVKNMSNMWHINTYRWLSCTHVRHIDTCQTIDMCVWLCDMFYMCFQMRTLSIISLLPAFVGATSRTINKGTCSNLDFTYMGVIRNILVLNISFIIVKFPHDHEKLTHKTQSDWFRLYTFTNSDSSYSLSTSLTCFTYFLLSPANHLQNQLSYQAGNLLLHAETTLQRKTDCLPHLWWPTFSGRCEKNRNYINVRSKTK